MPLTIRLHISCGGAVRRGVPIWVLSSVTVLLLCGMAGVLIVWAVLWPTPLLPGVMVVQGDQQRLTRVTFTAQLSPGQAQLQLSRQLGAGWSRYTDAYRGRRGLMFERHFGGGLVRKYVFLAARPQDTQATEVIVLTCYGVGWWAGCL